MDLDNELLTFTKVMRSIQEKLDVPHLKRIHQFVLFFNACVCFVALPSMLLIRVGL